LISETITDFQKIKFASKKMNY